MRKITVLAAVGWVYVALIALWLLLRAIFFDQLWWLAIANTLAEYLFLPLPLLLLAAAWQRKRVLLLGLAVPAATFVAMFGALFAPALGAPRVRGPQLTAMTFNVLWSNADTPALIGSIRASAPDVVGFQELTHKHINALTQALAGEYPYHTFQALAQVEDVGLISRFPIEDATAVALPPLNHALRVTLRVGERRMFVFVVHLTPNHLFAGTTQQIAAAARQAYGQRAAEVARLRQELAGLDAPALLLCDCNLSDTSEVYAQLAGFLDDSFYETGWGLGHTLYSSNLPFPTERIDYIWHTAGMTAISAHVGEPGGSDHLPVIARLRFSD